MTRTSWCITLGALLALGGAARADDGPCKTSGRSKVACPTSAETGACYPTARSYSVDNRQLTAEQKIELRLLTHYDLHWQETPLRQIIDHLHALTDINLVPDNDALREAGISLDLPLSLKVEDMSLKSALAILLKQARLTYVIKDEALQITTQEQAKGKLRTVTYPIADLILPIGSGEGELPAFICRYCPEFAGKPTSGRPAAEALIRLIINTIEPKSWADTNGKGTVQYCPMGLALVVNQTVDVQEQIADILAALRRAQAFEDREVTVTACVVTRTAKGDEVVQLPKTTFCRGQRVCLCVGDAVAIRTGTIRDCLRTACTGEEAQEEDGVPKPVACAKNGISLTLCVTKAAEDKLKFDATFEKSEITEATPTGLRLTGQTCRMIQQVESGDTVKMVLSKDERGKPRSWVMMTVTLLPVEEEEQTYLGNLPPIPR